MGKLSGTQVSQLLKPALSTLANTLSLIKQQPDLKKPQRFGMHEEAVSRLPTTLSLAHRTWHKAVRSVKYMSSGTILQMFLICILMNQGFQR